MSDFSDIKKRALEVRKQYEVLEEREYGRRWTKEELAMGLVGDVGDLMKLIAAKEGVRSAKDVDSKLGHELSDILWSIIVLAEKYGVDLEKEFSRTMDYLEKRIKAS